MATLKLRARNAEDMAVISALLQDGLVPVGDIGFMPGENGFVMALTRYRWEGASRERIHTGLRFEAVSAVRYRGIDRKDRSQFLSLLAISYEGDAAKGAVAMHFSGGGVIALEVDGLNCILADFDESWPTLWTPRHDLE
jgi:hypothetical protein